MTRDIILISNYIFFKMKASEICLLGQWTLPTAEAIWFIYNCEQTLTILEIEIAQFPSCKVYSAWGCLFDKDSHKTFPFLSLPWWLFYLPFFKFSLLLPSHVHSVSVLMVAPVPWRLFFVFLPWKRLPAAPLYLLFALVLPALMTSFHPILKCQHSFSWSLCNAY